MPVASRGYDGGRNINGRRRHIITDCLGLLLMVLVSAGEVTGRLRIAENELIARTLPQRHRNHAPLHLTRLIG